MTLDCQLSGLASKNRRGRELIRELFGAKKVTIVQLNRGLGGTIATLL